MRHQCEKRFTCRVPVHGKARDASNLCTQGAVVRKAILTVFSDALSAVSFSVQGNISAWEPKRLVLTWRGRGTRTGDS